MTDNTRNILVRAPITMLIGPVPDEVQSEQAQYKFAIANVSHILDQKGIKANIDGKRVIATVSIPNAPAKSIDFSLNNIDERVYRLQPDGDRHNLEISTDLGKTFQFAAAFADANFAIAVGDSWVDGVITKAE